MKNMFALMGGKGQVIDGGFFIRPLESLQSSNNWWAVIEAVNELIPLEKERWPEAPGCQSLINGLE